MLCSLFLDYAFYACIYSFIVIVRSMCCMFLFDIALDFGHKPGSGSELTDRKIKVSKRQIADTSISQQAACNIR